MTPLYDTSHCPCEVCGEGDWMIYYDISHSARVHKAWPYTKLQTNARYVAANICLNVFTHMR